MIDQLSRGYRHDSFLRSAICDLSRRISKRQLTCNWASGIGLDGYFVGGSRISVHCPEFKSPSPGVKYRYKSTDCACRPAGVTLEQPATIAAVAVHDAFFVGASCHASPAGEMPLS